MLISVLTGLAAGGMHVLGGADHLVAMAPSAIRHPKLALREGLAWGLGHSMGVLILSALAILIKDYANIQIMSSVADFVVGLVLLVIGFIAIKTAFGLNIHSHRHKHEYGKSHDHIHIHFRGRKKHIIHQHASTSLGVLHGLAGGSHFLAVIPALALPPLGAITYMCFYLIGSIFAMLISVFAISLAYYKIGVKALPAFIGFAGTLSIMTGFIWLRRFSLIDI